MIDGDKLAQDLLNDVQGAINTGAIPENLVDGAKNILLAVLKIIEKQHVYTKEELKEIVERDEEN